MPATETERLTEEGSRESSYEGLVDHRDGTFGFAVETRTDRVEPYGPAAMTRNVQWTGRHSIRAELEPRERVAFAADLDEFGCVASVSSARYEYDLEPETMTLLPPGGGELVVDAAPSPCSNPPPGRGGRC